VNLNSLPEAVRVAVKAAQSKKASDISVLDLKEAGAFTSYFVICTGFSTPQVQAICSEIEEQLDKQLGRSPEHREGHRSAGWALLDFGSFVVHVFGEQARHYYDLERLWRTVPKLQIADEAEGPNSRHTAQSTSTSHNTSQDDEHFSGEAVSK
jgi:ribosome-associated protein